MTPAARRVFIVFAFDVAALDAVLLSSLRAACHPSSSPSSPSSPESGPTDDEQTRGDGGRASGGGGAGHGGDPRLRGCDAHLREPGAPALADLSF